MKKRYDIIIIGGGASGLLLLANICNKVTRPTSIAMINTGHPIARGIAYSTSNVNHLLNVRVSRMSAFTEILIILRIGFYQSNNMANITLIH